MDTDFFKSRREGFKAWWATPPTRLERFGSAMLGLWAFLLVGVVLGFVFAPNHSLSISALLLVASGSAISGTILGAAFPKHMRCLALPFAFVGVGSWGS
jgi:hypothetical protein